MSSRGFEAVVSSIAYYFLRGIACELKNTYRGGSYEVEPIAVVSPMGDLIGYEINGKMLRIKKMKLVPIMEDVNNVYRAERVD